ncbi:MAG: hypothetical protein IIY21_06185 [Clostridiales bacterium]|nr:hypothetical protein [Clostridiales bacterium]
MEYKYIVATIKYTDRPSNGKHTHSVLNALYDKAEEWTLVPTLTWARKYAYQKLSHNGFNKEGKYMCLIIKNERGPYKLAGEVLNTAYDDRYWYPSNDGVYASAGKYTLYKDGTLGRRLR